MALELGAALILGLTAGLCPICWLFSMPILPHIVSRCKGLKSSILSSLEFSSAIALVFTPLGALAPYAMNFLTGRERGWAYLGAGLVSMFVGLWALRILKVPYRSVCKKFNLKLLGSSTFAYGFSYGLATVGRGAPLLISMLSIVAASGNAIVGAAALCIYAFCNGLPLVMLATIAGLSKTQEFIFKHSRKLDAVSGMLLCAIGAYYLWLFISWA